MRCIPHEHTGGRPFFDWFRKSGPLFIAWLNAAHKPQSNKETLFRGIGPSSLIPLPLYPVPLLEISRESFGIRPSFFSIERVRVQSKADVWFEPPIFQIVLRLISQSRKVRDFITLQTEGRQP